MTGESHADYRRRQLMIRNLSPVLKGLLAMPVWIVWCFVPYRTWDEWKYFSHLCHHFDYR